MVTENTIENMTYFKEKLDELDKEVTEGMYKFPERLNVVQFDKLSVPKLN